MTHKDAKKTTNHNKRWVIIAAAILLLVSTVTARVYWLAPDEATAEQTPAPSSATAPTQNPAAKSAPITKPTTQSVATRTVGQTSELKIVAEVNNQQIKRNQLAQACLDRYGKEVLESFLNKKLIQQDILFCVLNLF